MIRVALVDDHALVRRGVMRLLADMPGVEVVGEGRTGEDALALVRREEPDVLLLDVTMPGMSGIEVTRRVQRAVPEVRIIALSIHADGPFPACMMDLGASGYLTKGCDAKEMLKAIQRVHQGHRYVSADVAQNMVLKQISGQESPMGALAPRELEVMLMLSEGQTLHEISDRLCVSPKTVSTYRTRIMRKLGTSSNVELTHLAFRHGLIQPLPAG